MGIAKKTTWIVIALVVLTLLALPKILSSRQNRNQMTSGSVAERGAQVVHVYDVAPSPLEDRLVVNGTLLGEDSVELRSETTGRVTAIPFKEGTAVKKGELLVKLDDSELQARLRALELQVTLAEKEEARQRQLFKSGGTAEQDYEQTANQLKVLRAEADLIRAQIDKTELRAPFDGQVGLRQVSPGAMVQPDTPITTIQNLAELKIDFPVPERYLSEVREGMKFRLQVEGREEDFEGEVVAIEPRIDPATRTLELRGRVPNPDGRLFPGGYATVRLVLRDIPDALMVPATALVPEMEAQTLFVVKDGQVEQRKVEAGIRLDDRVQIVSGLEPGERVVISGVQGLRQGQPVEVLEKAPAGKDERDVRS